MGETQQLNWELLYGTRHLYKAEILKALLEEADIQTVIINKQDSAYITIGEIEVYVNRNEIIKAIDILKRFEADE